MRKARLPLRPGRRPRPRAALGGDPHGGRQDAQSGDSEVGGGRDPHPVDALSEVPRPDASVDRGRQSDLRGEAEARRAGDPGKKGALEPALDGEIAAELNRLLGAEGPASFDFGALERGLREGVLAAAAKILQQVLNADSSDQASADRPCACGRPARFAGRHDKWITTLFSRMRLSRAYYHCTGCGTGFYPRDREWGLEGSALSPGLTRLVGRVAAEVSFGSSSELLRELAGVAVDAKQVERSAEALGEAIARDEREQVLASSPTAGTMYLGLDGTGLPVRPAECAGRPGKQPDGSARTREVKLVQVWTASRPSPEGPVQREAGSVSYSAAVESVACADTERDLSAFAQRVEREAKRRGFDRAARQVVLGDGAAWIWNLVSEVFPRAIQIVDLFHARERLWKVAQERYGPDNELRGVWARRRCEELEAGPVEPVITALQALGGAEAAAAAGYFRNNRHRMRYATFRRMGLGVASGVVEAGCKQVVGARLKRSGMHWTVAGGNAILALRCCLLSGRFEDFWARREQAGNRLIVFSTTDPRAESAGPQGDPESKYVVGGR